MARAAAISVPTSMVPCCSMVTDTIRGRRVPVASKASINGVQGGFDLQHVLAGFHQQQVGAAINQPLACST
jgi:hypothetical protein